MGSRIDCGYRINLVYEGMQMIGRYNEDADDVDAYLSPFDNAETAWLPIVPAISDIARTLIPVW